MNGRVLSEEEIRKLEIRSLGKSDQVVPNLITTIRDRDKTIVESQETINDSQVLNQQHRKVEQWLREQNAIMLSVLERLEAKYKSLEPVTGVFEIIYDTLTKVKALTVSRQGETSDASVPSEQP